MGIFSEIFAAVGSWSGGKRKTTTDGAQHGSPAKRSKQNSPCQPMKQSEHALEQHFGQQRQASKPALAPVVAQQQEQLPKPFQHVMRQPQANKTFERRKKQPVQNAFKQFGNTAPAPLSQLPASASKPKSKPMQYFAGGTLQQHGSSPVLGWSSGTPQQHLRSQPRFPAPLNSSRYKINHQGAQQQQPQLTAPQAAAGPAAYIFGPEIAATPVASTPEIKQRLFHDSTTAVAAAGSRYLVHHRRLASTAAGGAPPDALQPAAADNKLATGDGLQHLAGTFSAALGEEASGLGLGLKHSPAGLARAAAAAGGLAGAAAAAGKRLASAVSNNPLLLASITAPSAAAEDERLQREVAALQHKLQKRQQHGETFASTYQTLSQNINKALLTLSSDYEVNPNAGSGMQQLQIKAAQLQQQRLEQEAVRLQQQRQQLSVSPMLLQLQQQNPFSPALKLQQQPTQQQENQHQQQQQQQEQSSEVLCISDGDEDQEEEEEVVDGVDSQQVQGGSQEELSGEEQDEEAEGSDEEEDQEGVGSNEEERSEEYDAALGQLQRLHLEWQGQRSNWEPTEEEFSRFDQATSQAGDLQEVITAHTRSNIELTRSHFGKLCEGEWLNDEIINMYIAMLLDRDKAMRDHPELRAPKCHFFNTFFLNKLYKDAKEKQNMSADAAYCYNNVRRWTTPKKLAIAGQASDSVLKLDRIIIPVHEGVHWTAAMVDLVNKRFVFFDSFGGCNVTAIQALKKWLRDEAKDKLKEDWDCLTWEEQYPKNIPKQHNGCDCGVFSLLFCNRLGAGMAFDFAQSDLEINARVKVACELLDGKLPLPEAGPPQLQQ